MLPGIRILFATFVLSASVLIFGLGAAALLRSAHEEFVGIPAWRAAQQPMAPAMDTNRPILSLARVDPDATTRSTETKTDRLPKAGTPVEDTRTASLDAQATEKKIAAENIAAEETPKIGRKSRVRKAKRTRTVKAQTIRHWRAGAPVEQTQQSVSNSNSPFAGFEAPDQQSSGTGSNRRTAARSPF